MKTHVGLTRRQLLAGTAAGSAAAAAGIGPKIALAAPAVLRKGSKLTYWGGLIFSDKANKLLVDTINHGAPTTASRPKS